MDTVLLVDDEFEIIELMRDFLEAESFQFLSASSGEEALTLFASYKVDCVLLDLMMPGMNGFTVCKKIREISDVPVLFLTAVQEDTDKIRGLQIGADDFIVKSATPGEIVARIKAVLRRTRLSNAPSEQPSSMVYRIGELAINISTREVNVRDKSISLTPIEFHLLQLFVEHPKQVFTHEHLYEKVWGDTLFDAHSVRVAVARLREKIELNPSEPQWIHTVWGVGYKFEYKPSW